MRVCYALVSLKQAVVVCLYHVGMNKTLVVGRVVVAALHGHKTVAYDDALGGLKASIEYCRGCWGRGDWRNSVLGWH